MFLTRLPVGRWASGDAAVLAHSTQYFPVVGLLVGSIGALVLWAAALLWPLSIAVLVTLGVLLLVTGGFHEDGLADLADSAGGWTIERRLDIMRDSRLGTYGVLALILMILLKFFALLTIASSDLQIVMVALIVGHVAGRWSSLPLIRTTPYARPDSNNKTIAEAVDNQRLFVGTIISVVVLLGCVMLIGTKALLVLLITLMLVAVSRWWYLKKLGGVTGDALGATNVMVETAVYLMLAAGL